MQTTLAESAAPAIKEKNFLSYHVSAKFLWSILSLREVIYPITVKKFIIWIVYSVILAGLIVLEVMLGFVKYLEIAVTAKIIPLFVSLLAIEPVQTLAYILSAKYTNPAADPSTIPSSLRSDVTIIIACHNSCVDSASKTKLKDNIERWLSMVTPDCIVIIDNGSDKPEQTKTFINELNYGVRYVYSKIGNKTISVYIAASVHATTPYVIICDDDIKPAYNCLEATRLLDDKHKMAVYPVRAINPDREKKRGDLSIQWQDIEYEQAEMANMIADRAGCGPIAPHGAASLWDRKFMLTVLRKHHDLEFKSEDWKMGIIALLMGNIARLAIGMEVQTYAPNTLLGEMPNLYTQRTRSWNVGPVYYSYKMVSQFFTVWPRSLPAILVLKWQQFYFLFQVASDVIRLPVFLLACRYWQYWAVTAGQHVVMTILLLGYNYIKLRNHPELQHKLLPILTFWIYKIISHVFSVLGFFRTLFIYFPNSERLIRINEREAAAADMAAQARAIGARPVIIHGLVDARSLRQAPVDPETPIDPRVLPPAIFPAAVISQIPPPVTEAMVPVVPLPGHGSMPLPPPVIPFPLLRQWETGAPARAGSNFVPAIIKSDKKSRKNPEGRYAAVYCPDDRIVDTPRDFSPSAVP